MATQRKSRVDFQAIEAASVENQVQSTGKKLDLDQTRSDQKKPDFQLQLYHFEKKYMEPMKNQFGLQLTHTLFHPKFLGFQKYSWKVCYSCASSLLGQRSSVCLSTRLSLAS